MRLKSFIGTAIRRITGAREREAPAELARQVRDAIDRNAHELALRLAHEALARYPDFAELHYLQGLAMHSGSDPERALESLERAVELEPEHAEAWNSMASVLQTLGRISDARTAVERAVALGLNPALAHHNLGILAAIEGNLELACHHFGLATAADPGFATAHFNLGKALNDLGRSAEGSAALLRASELEGDGRAAVRHALAVPPILENAGEALAIRAAMGDALRRLRGIPIENPVANVDLSWFGLAYHGVDDTILNRQIAEFFVSSCPELQFEAPHCRQKRRPRERLRVGFLSRYLYGHSIGRTTRGVVPRLSRELFEVYAIFPAPVVDDPVSREIRAGADHSIIVPNSLQSAREAIAALELDILFYQDLGMDQLTYFLAFSRLAPVQCVGWGHPVTSGIPTVDFFVSTRGFEPPDGAAHYNERLLLMEKVATPSYYLRLDTGLATLSRRDAGFEDSATAYFCPQTLIKLHPDFDSVLAGILRADPKGILYLLDYQNAAVEQLKARLRRNLEAEAGRIRFLPRMPGVEHYYSRLKHADVLLDTLHFGGGNTSLEGFAFGAPIVTLPGRFMRGRHTLGMYRAMGIQDCIAATAGEYVEIAARIGMDDELRADLRGRIQVANSVLYEDPDVVRELERALGAAAGGGTRAAD